MVDWVHFPAEALLKARTRRGLSYETMGRAINVAAKTWERYEKKNRVPRHLLPRVAEVLDLEIEWPERQKVEVSSPATETSLRDLGEMRIALARIEQMLRERLDPPQDEPESA